MRSFSILFRLGLVLAISTAIIGPVAMRGAQNRRAAAAPAVNEIQVVSAIFGAGQRTADVTARVEELVRPRGGLITVNATTLGADPAPGAKKKLTITYKYRDGTYVFTVNSGQSFYYATLVSNAQTDAKAEAPTAAIQALSPEQMAAIVIIEGNEGAGTGFVARVGDQICVVTNLHVLGDNDRLAVKTLKGETIAIAGITAAIGADIALLRVANPAAAPAPLELAGDVQNLAKIGGKVVVAGNRLGGGVITQTGGQLKGIGPARVEVDARFQPGNSGSPIIDLESKKVIGVAAYTSTRNVEGSSLFSLHIERRWFGYRLDTATKWEPIDWAKWQSQIKQVGAFEEVSSAIIPALISAEQAAQVELPALRAIIKPYDPVLARISRATRAAPPTTADLAELRAMFGKIRAFAERDVRRFSTASYYDYFLTAQYPETNVKQLVDVRNEIIKQLKSAEHSAEFMSLQIESSP